MKIGDIIIEPTLIPIIRKTPNNCIELNGKFPPLTLQFDTKEMRDQAFDDIDKTKNHNEPTRPTFPAKAKKHPQVYPTVLRRLS